MLLNLDCDVSVQRSGISCVAAVTCLFVFCSGSVAAQTPPVQTPPANDPKEVRRSELREMNREATALLERKQLSAARDVFSRVLTKNPNDIVALRGLAIACRRVGDSRAAMAAYRAGIYESDGRTYRGSSLDQDPSFMLPYAILLQDAGEHEEAFTIYSRVAGRVQNLWQLKLKPLSGSHLTATPDFTVAALLRWAVDSHLHGNDQDAFACFRRATRLRPRNAYAHYGLANLLKSTRDRHEMVDEARKAFTHGTPEIRKAVAAEFPSVVEQLGTDSVRL